MDNPLISHLERLLKENNISFSENELTFQIQSHPSYPSLHSITEVLDHFNIDNVAVTVTVDSVTLNQLPASFMAEVEKESVKDLVFVKKDKVKYTVYYSEGSKDKFSEEEFLKIFTGIVLATEKKDIRLSHINSNYFLKKNAFYFLLAAYYIFFLSFKLTLPVNFYFILSVLGVMVSMAIVKQELGLSSVIGSAFCSSVNEKKDCNTVLSSVGSTILNRFKLSDISLIYFLGLVFSIFLISINAQSIESLYYISFSGIPVIFYSLLYQYRIVKNWCFLCLTIAFILSCQASFIFSLSKIDLFSLLDNSLTLVCSYVLVFFIAKMIKKNYQETLEAKNTKLEYHIFKRNYKIFLKLFNSNPEICTKLENIPEIVFGNKNSSLEITLITNPFCSHCIAVHKTMENLLFRYKDEVKIIVRFSVRPEQSDSNPVKVSARLLEMYSTEEKANCLLAMSEIYGGMIVGEWLKKWGECKNMQKYLPILKLEREWCLKNSINFTPEILINGRSFPREYKREDITYFIENLYEEVAA